jgi:hypothetical protein
MESLKCPVCESDFQQTRNSQKYCSTACKKERDRAAIRKKNNLELRSLKCPECSSPFETYKARQVYCCVLCERESVRKAKICGKKKPCHICGTEFVRDTHHKNFCSEKCKKEGEKRRHQKAVERARIARNNNAARAKRTWQMERVCAREVCDQTFIPQTRRNLYCSKTCRDRVLQEQKRNVTLRSRKFHDRNCGYCGKPFRTSNSKSLTCSSECAKRFFVNNKKTHDEATGLSIQEKKREGFFEMNGYDAGHDAIFTGDAAEDYTLTSWGRLLRHCKIDLTPSDLDPADSDFSVEIQNYLKRGGTIKKLKVGFCFHPITV